MEGLVSSTELSFIEGMNGRDAPIGMLERSTFSLSDRSRLSGELFDRMHTNAPDNQLTMAVYSAAQFAEHVLLKSGSSGDVSMPQDSSSKEALLSIKNIDDCRDSRGNARGACSEDDCEFYSPPAQGSKCDYCDCPAPKHKKLTAEGMVASAFISLYFGVIHIRVCRDRLHNRAFPYENNKVCQQCEQWRSHDCIRPRKRL